MTTTPHATWAHAYDAIFESSFGGTYAKLTDKTLAYVRELVQPAASIVDFGAATHVVMQKTLYIDLDNVLVS